MGEDDIQLVGFINCGGCPGKKRCCGPVLWQKEIGDGVRILDYTHDAGPEPETSQK